MSLTNLFLRCNPVQACCSSPGAWPDSGWGSGKTPTFRYQSLVLRRENQTQSTRDLEKTERPTTRACALYPQWWKLHYCHTLLPPRTPIVSCRRVTGDTHRKKRSSAEATPTGRARGPVGGANHRFFFGARVLVRRHGDFFSHPAGRDYLPCGLGWGFI